MAKQKRPLVNLYYLHYSDPVTMDEIADVFSYDDLPVQVTPILPGSFLIATELSFSEIKHSLSFYYAEEHAELARVRVVMKLKGESAPEFAGPWETIPDIPGPAAGPHAPSE